MKATKAFESRPLTGAERNLAASIFGNAVDYAAVLINRRKWWFFQPRHVAMAPDGALWFHPEGSLWCDDFACQGLAAQALFIHEMTHVWQHQRGVWLPLARHPFCRYGYTLQPGRPLVRYGIEQQAEIVKHAWLLRQGAVVPGAPALSQYESLLPFRPS
jgi:hypothetical protein